MKSFVKPVKPCPACFAEKLSAWIAVLTQSAASVSPFASVFMKVILLIFIFFNKNDDTASYLLFKTHSNRESLCCCIKVIIREVIFYD